MTFTTKDKMKALAIVHVFETSRPFGDYGACVVLDDGAGVSYGINQFTHRSGSLAAVVREYLAIGGQVGREKLVASLPLLAKKTVPAIERLAADSIFRKTLRLAALTSEMRLAQRRVADERYLKPAVEICERRGFVTPLALAVIYDSVTHGSFELISARVSATVRTVINRKDDLAFEKAWITEYIRARHRWLTDIRRLRVTSYRTKFFLDQIAISNWDLQLPVTVHGVRLTSVGEPEPGAITTGFPQSQDMPEVEKPSIAQSVSELASSATEKFDRVDSFVSAVTARRDSAKSLWATVGGTVSQVVWGIVGFVIGLPRTVWIVVAVIAGSLTLLYLYRQIALGRIRETTEQKLTTAL